MKTTVVALFIIGCCVLPTAKAGLWSDYAMKQGETRSTTTSSDGGIADAVFSPHDAFVSPHDIEKHARKLAVSSFMPLMCNSVYSECASWTSTQDAYTNSTTGWVRIPCGKCVTMDITDGRTVTINGGLQIQGKLVFSPTSRVTLVMNMMVVEGELAIMSTEPITGQPKITFQIKDSSTTLSFEPHPQNAAACGMSTCQLGRQAIVVAGGKLNIKGMPDNCPAWVTVQGAKSGEMAVATSNAATLGNSTVPDGCDEKGAILSADFSSGLGNWSGELGTISKIVDSAGSWDGTSSYLSITSRAAVWQGTNYIVSDSNLKCLQPNVPFMFSAKVRLTGADGKTSICSTGKTNPTALSNCPKMRLNYIDGNGINIWRVLSSIGSSQVKADGEWMNLTSSVTFTKVELAASNVYLKLTIDGPEGDIDMAVGAILLVSPIAAMSSAGPMTCQDLIVNGKADSGITYPWTPYVSTDPQPIIQTETGGNKFFTQTQRSYPYSSITISLNPECIVSGSTYAFTSQLRVKSTTTSTFRVLLRAIQANGLGTQVAIASCQPGPTTWTTCAASYTFTDSDASAVSVQIYFYGVTDFTSDVDYDTISFTYLLAGGSRAILPTSVASCWGPNATLAVPSDSLTYNGGTTTMVESIDKVGGFLKTQTDFNIPGTTATNPDYAGQIALLSRNILFKGDDGSDLAAGPHLIIYRTPGVAQLIDGVAFSGFGRPGEAQRFPINFYMSGNATASVVSRNSITDSKHRCIVISGTDRVTVSGNVAYNTAGHCYVLEQGSERVNVFDGNFGALQTAPTSTITGATDNDPATYYITAPENTFTNNVAAGSVGHGFWLNIPAAVNGESAFTSAGYSPSSRALKSFVGNVAHSNRFYGLNQATVYTPNKPSIIQNFRSYRNSLGGVYFWNARNIQFDGAVIADNKIGMNLNYMNGLVVNNSKIIGYSPEYQRSVASNGYASHCYGTSAGLYGIELFVNGMDPTWSGNTISNVAFKNMTDTTGCLGSKALMFNPVSKTKTYDVSTSIENLSFDGSFANASSSKLNLCDADSNGVSNIMVGDDGSLFPTSNGSGVVVSNNPALLENLKDCVDIPGACAKYCAVKSGACMRQVTVSVDHQSASGLFLIVSGGNMTQNVSGSFTSVSDLVDRSWMSRTIYSFSLGAGKYIGTFKDNVGHVVWPGGAAVVYGGVPGCKDYFEWFKLFEPNTSLSACYDLIEETNFEAGSLATSRWSHTGSGLKYQMPGYPGVGSALQTEFRTAVSQGPAIFLDTRCLNDIGFKYLFSAQVYLVNSVTGSAEYCDAADRIGPFRCPRANLATFKGSNNITSYQFDAANAVGPWYNDSWNTLRGPIVVDSYVADADFVAIYLDNLRVGVEMRIDEVHLTPFNVACPKDLNQIKNGGFERGTYEFWWYYGSTTKIQIVSPGYNDNKYAASTVQRDSPTVGLTQTLNPSCFKRNQLYVINLHFQLKTYDGVTFVCNPYGANTEVCPSASLQVTSGTNVQYIVIGTTVGPVASDWPLITGVFNATSAITDATDLELFINGAWSGYNLIIDDVDISMASLVPESQSGIGQVVLDKGECYNLAQNGDLSIGDARFWDVTGSGTQLAMYGYLSAGSPALRVTGRTASFAGAMQHVNQACLIEGMTWTVQAKIKLMNDTYPIGCDKSATWGDSQCPGITFTASKRDSSSTLMTKVLTLRNMIDNPWDNDAFNEFHSTFTVTNEMAKWDSLVFSTDLTRPGVDVIFDDLRIIRTGN